VTRPLGASFADYLGRPHELSGLNLGSGPVAVVVTIVGAVLVGYLSVTRRDVRRPQEQEHAGHSMVKGDVAGI
jgi:uncharacterized membrane-anchored protein